MSACVLAGCAAAPEPFTRDFLPAQPIPEAAQYTPTGSLFLSGHSQLFGQPRASRVGDSITILLQEQAQSERSQRVSVGRESSNDLFTANQVGRLASQGGRVLGRGEGFLNEPSLFNGASITSEGGGESGQSLSLDGSVTGTVMQVLANGNLVIQGEKILTTSDGSERMRVRGVIRPQDISQNNTVLSYRIAGAEISYEGRGDLANASRPGWATRFFNRVWPF